VATPRITSTLQDGKPVYSTADEVVNKISKKYKEGSELDYLTAMVSHWETKKNAYDAALKFAEAEFSDRVAEEKALEKKLVDDDLAKKNVDAKKLYDDKVAAQAKINTDLKTEEDKLTGL